MPEFWQEVLCAVNAILLDMPYHGPLLNERYLHHFFSHRIQSIMPCPMALLDRTAPLRFHPEWPTSKKATKIACGTYQKQCGLYLPTDARRKGGFVDFAIGPYACPEIGVEFKLFNNGWKRESVTFDYIKLLDSRNPFKAVVSAIVILRPERVAIAGWREALLRAINSSYQEAVHRLRIGSFAADAHRLQRFVVTEVAPNERRHWYNGSVGGVFTQDVGVPLLDGETR